MNNSFSIKKHIIKTKSLKAVIIVSLLGGANTVWALDGCPLLIAPSPASIDIDPTLPVGSVIATITLNWPKTLNPAGCPKLPTGTGLYKFYGVGTPNGNLYPTNIPGVSYRGNLPDWSFAGLGNYWPTQAIYSVHSESNGASAGSAVIDFIKTGPVQAGTFGPQYIMHSNIAGIQFMSIYMSTPVIIKPKNPSCTVVGGISGINVALDDVFVSELNTAGKTAKPKNFTIPINCTSPANISISFSGDMANLSNGVFQNNNTYTNAKNVGIQLLDNNGNAVNTSSVVNIGQISGLHNYTMTARYYSVTGNASVGKVDSVANATIRYN